MVFDDHFHTVYGDGEGNLITDTICNLLWENNQELYAEDKYGPDGLFIYTPPPLDKVWLDEERLCEHHQQLLDQHCRVEHQTCLVKIETVKQLGGLFTKALPRVQFEYLRKNLMGW